MYQNGKFFYEEDSHKRSVSVWLDSKDNDDHVHVITVSMHLVGKALYRDGIIDTMIMRKGRKRVST